MIPNHKLRHAVTLAEHKNFRRAAEVLNLTQPALSRSIQSLERTLGVRLFDRSRGGVELTTLGRLVLDRAREILAAVGELEHEVALMQGLSAGTLEVSLGPFPAALSGRPALANFVATYPEIQCRVRVAGYSRVADDVAQGHCELGVADLEVASERGLTTEVLVDRRVYLFARPQHPLASQRRCTVDDAMRYPWAGIRAPSRIGPHLPADPGRAGHWDGATGEFVPVLEFDVVSDLLPLARESEFLVAATLTMAEDDLKAGTLAVVKFSAPWLKLFYGFISRPNRTLSPATLRFQEIVREIEAELDERERALRKRFL
jgi:DNA-binding transcriptional LysR family regulator